MKKKIDYNERVIKTFIETLLAYIAVNIWNVDFSKDKEVLIHSLIALITSGVSATISAIINLEKDDDIEIDEVDIYEKNNYYSAEDSYKGDC